VNAPLWIPNQPAAAAPKPGAICLSEDSPLGRAGQWIEFDRSGGGIINLSTGALLPLAGGRSTSPMHFAGAPPAPTDVHTPIAIAGYLAGYRNKKFLLDTLVQSQPVDFTQFVYRSFNAATTYLVQDARASELSSPPQVQFTSATTTDKTQDLRMATFIPYRAEQQADFPFIQAASRNLWNKIMLWREYTAFASGSLYMTSGNWASAIRTALGGTQNWGPPGSEGSDSNPPRDLRAARAASLESITYFAMNLIQFDWFTQHPATIDHYKAFNPAGNTAGMLRDAFAAANDPQRQLPFEFDVPMIGKIVVHDVRATTDSATAPDRFWPNDIVLGFHLADNMPPNFEVCTAVNFRLKNPTNGSAPPAIPGAPDGVPTNNGWRVRMVPVPLIGSGGDLMIVDLSEKQVMTANNVGAYISGVS
jgi:hypothetical protein